VESEISVVVPHNLLHNRYMIETVLPILMFTGVALTGVAAVFVTYVAAKHNL